MECRGIEHAAGDTIQSGYFFMYMKRQLLMSGQERKVSEQERKVSVKPLMSGKERKVSERERKVSVESLTSHAGWVLSQDGSKP